MQQRFADGIRSLYTLRMRCVQSFVLLASAVCGTGALYSQQADMVLVHGAVLTVNAKDAVAQGIAVRSGTIAAVGTDAQIMKLRGRRLG